MQPGIFASSLLSHLPAGLSLPLQPAQVPKSPRHLLCSSRWVYFTSPCSKAGPQVGVWVLQDGAGAEQCARSCGLLGGRWKIQNSSARLRLASFFFSSSLEPPRLRGGWHTHGMGAHSPVGNVKNTCYNFPFPHTKIY